MKRSLFFLLIFISVYTAKAQYKAIDQGSEVKFTIENFGFNVTGSFTGIQGSIHFDPQNPVNDSFDVSVDARTINTDNSMRDAHLKEGAYFDVKDYPRIQFTSHNVTQGSKRGIYTTTGRLTIKGKSKEITFPFTAIAVSEGWQLKGAFKINRKDFGIGGSSTIANELEVSLNVTAKKY